MYKKIFSFLILAAALLCSGNAWAAAGDSAEEPIEISANIPSTYTFTAGKYYKITANVTCSTSITVAVNFIESDKTLTFTSNQTISAGAYHCPVVLTGKTCKITGENTEFYKAVTCAGTQSNSYGIQQGTFHGVVTSSGYIMNGTFEGQVTSSYYIYGGTFKNTVTSSKYIYGGTFEKKVYSTSSITNATSGSNVFYPTFKDSVLAKSITGGVFHRGVKLNVSGGVLKGGVFDSVPTFSNGASMPATHTMVTSNTTPYRYLVSEAKYVGNEKVAQGMFLKYLGAGDFIDAASEVKEVQGNNYHYVVFKDDLKNDSLYKGAYLYNPHASLIAKGYSVANAMNNKDTYQFSYYFIGKNATTMMYPGYSWGWQVLTGGTFEFDLEQYTDSCIHPDYEVKEIEKGKKWQVQLNEALTVAKIGDIAYGSLDDALTASKDGDIIKLNKNIVANIAYFNNTGKSITLDLNGDTLSSTSGNTLEIQGNGNKTFTITSSVAGKGSIQAQETALVVGCGLTSSQSPVSVVINNANLKGASAIKVVGKDGYSADITINGGRFEGNLEKNSFGSYTISDGTFTVDPSCVNPTITDCRGITQEIPTEWIVKEIKYDISVGTCENGSVLIDGVESENVCHGTTVTLSNTPAQNYKLVTYLANGVAIDGNTYTVVEDNVEITATFVAKDYICQIGTDGAKFETLKEASAAVLANQTIYLTKNYITSKNDTLKTTKENVLVDLNGYAITFNGSASMSVNGRLTIKNGSINGNANYLIYTSGYDLTIDARSPLTFENLTMNGGFNMKNTDATYINCTIDASTKDYYALYTDPLGAIGCSITIKSGYYAGKSQFACLNANPSLMTIYEGFFNSDPAAYKAEGCSVIPSEDAKYPYEVARVYSRENLTLGRIGTICLPYDVEAGGFKGANFYEIAYKEDGKVYFDQVDALQAGYAYVFEPSATKIECKQTGDAVDTEVPANGLYGTFNGITADQSTLVGNYLVSNNVIQKCAQGSWLGANRAYIVMSEVPGDSTPQAPGRKRIVLGSTQANTPTDLVEMHNAQCTMQNGKFILNGQFVIVKDGKKFNAQGMEL